MSDVLNGTEDYLNEDFHKECERHIPHTDDIETSQASNAYLYLKAHFDEDRIGQSIS